MYRPHTHSPSLGCQSQEAAGWAEVGVRRTNVRLIKTPTAGKGRWPMLSSSLGNYSLLGPWGPARTSPAASWTGPPTPGGGVGQHLFFGWLAGPPHRVLKKSPPLGTFAPLKLAVKPLSSHFSFQAVKFVYRWPLLPANRGPFCALCLPNPSPVLGRPGWLEELPLGLPSSCTPEPCPRPANGRRQRGARRVQAKPLPSLPQC